MKNAGKEHLQVMLCMGESVKIPLLKDRNFFRDIQKNSFFPTILGFLFF
jgi:hypothetical protein